MDITHILYTDQFQATPSRTHPGKTHICIGDVGSAESQDFVQDEVGQEQLETALGLHMTVATSNTTTKEADVGRLE